MTLIGKLWTILILFTISVLCLFLFFLKNELRSIQAIDVQIAANRFQKPLRRILEYLPQHDTKIYRILTGDTAAKEGLNTLDAQMTEQVRQLNAAFETYRGTIGGRLLGLGKNMVINPRSPPNLFKKWEELHAQSLDLTPAGSVSAHTQLIRDLKDLISLFGDVSRLVVVNDIETFYSMETTMVDLPEVQEYLNNIVLIGDEALHDTKLSEKMREELYENLALLRVTLDYSEKRIGRSYQADVHRGVNQDLSQLFFNFTNEVTEFIQFAKKNVLTTSLPTEDHLKDFLSKASDAQEASFLFWDLAVDRLDESLRSKKTSILMTLFLVLCLSIGGAILAIILGLSILKNLKNINLIAQKNNSLLKTVGLANSSSLENRENIERIEKKFKEILESCKTIAAKLVVLGEKVGGITGVASNITKVADQTNLLSLNASIEAEKAGEFGKSFSVIAREIRRLADLITHAASDIQKITGEIITAVTTSQEGVKSFSQEVKASVDEIDKVNQELSYLISETSALKSEP